MHPGGTGLPQCKLMHWIAGPAIRLVARSGGGGVPNHKDVLGASGGKRKHEGRFSRELRTLFTSWAVLGLLTNALGHSILTSKMGERGIVVHGSNFSRVYFQ